MTRSTSLFVYGTLRHGQPNAFLLEPFADSIDPGWVEGELFDIGGWPALLPGTAQVCGEIVRISHASPARVLIMVDDLEGFDPADRHSSSYLRESVQAASESGVYCRAYVYFYNLGRRSFAPSSPLIPIASGDWLR